MMAGAKCVRHHFLLIYKKIKIKQTKQVAAKSKNINGFAEFNRRPLP